MVGCVPAVHHKTGAYLKPSAASSKARWFLEQREGPPPFEGAICRHLCENDSMMPNGFICTLHTTWGTYTQNELDKLPETRTKRSKKAGFVSSKIEHACPKCGRIIKGPSIGRHVRHCG